MDQEEAIRAKFYLFDTKILRREANDGSGSSNRAICNVSSLLCTAQGKRVRSCIYYSIRKTPWESSSPFWKRRASHHTRHTPNQPPKSHPHTGAFSSDCLIESCPFPSCFSSWHCIWNDLCCAARRNVKQNTQQSSDLLLLFISNMLKVQICQPSKVWY